MQALRVLQNAIRERVEDERKQGLSGGSGGSENAFQCCNPFATGAHGGEASKARQSAEQRSNLITGAKVGYTALKLAGIAF